MWNTESSRKAVLAEGRYVEAENGHCGRQKLSSGMAMVLGALLTMAVSYTHLTLPTTPYV